MAKQRRLKSPDAIISKLPDEIIERILVFLPIKDAVKTSVLSREWRYKWTFIPELLFEEDYKTHNLVTMIDRVLLVHRGPILKFEVSTKNIKDGAAIDSWIRFLSGKKIKELKLGFFEEIFLNRTHTRLCFEVPSTLFSLQALTSLELYGDRFILKPPCTFEGLRNLKILRLEKVKLPESKIFQNMISNLPVLEKLSLDAIINSFTPLKVSAPNLRHFFFRGDFKDICFMDAPHLIDVFMDVINFPYGDELLTSNLSNVLGCLIGIEKFAMVGFLVECLARFDLPRCLQLPITYHHLNRLSLEVYFEDLNQILVTVGLLKSSPNLQNLEIHARLYALGTARLVEDFWKAHDQLDCSMNHLNMVKIIRLSGTQTELEFIKFLLANSPLLEVLNLTPRYNDIDKLMIFKELLRFQRASANAKIEFNEFRRFKRHVSFSASPFIGG